MTWEEKERAMALARVEYNNNWQNSIYWKCDAHESLDEVLARRKIDSLFIPVKVESSAVEAMLSNDTINRVFSAMIDINDMLPYHPELGFEIAWRELELISKAFLNDNKRDETGGGITKLIPVAKKIADVIVNSVCKSNPTLDALIEKMLSDTPLPVYKFTILRMYREFELSVDPQYGSVKDRAKGVLGDKLYEEIDRKYSLSLQEKPTAENLRKASSLLRLILSGKPLADLNNHSYNAFSLRDRLVFYITCVLYTARCERFHGDYFSPFKGSMSTVGTFCNYYWQMVSCYFLTWLVLYSYAEKNNTPQLCKMQNILDAIAESFNRISLIKEKNQ